ncbi:hypothetical protein LCGC14_0736310 [marine sediment metagenome]|uniref:Uncharacterized protein n=1 Tax=marine sediment metagenome TaxID=412755 RepID=A0A0F9TF80_9ZZZZ
MGFLATWGQQPNESEKAWQAFKAYRNMGVTRSLRKASSQIGKSRRLLETWSSKHMWQRRCAAWDIEQQDIHREARLSATQDMQERHGKLARGLLGRVAAELGAQVKGRCTKCGRSPVKLTAAQVASAMKAGVEVERLSLGLNTAGAPLMVQNNVTNITTSGVTALVILRDSVSQQLASDLLGRMKALDPATAMRGVAGAQAAAAIARANALPGKAVTGRAAKNAAKAEVLAERAAAFAARGEVDPLALEREAASEKTRTVHQVGKLAEASPTASMPLELLGGADPSGGDRTLAQELGLGSSAEELEDELEQARADAETAVRTAKKSVKNARERARAKERQAAAAANDDEDLF